MKNMKEREEGYYFIKLHPIYEDSNWHIGYWQNDSWYLHNLEGNADISVDSIGDKVNIPKND